MTEYDQLIQRGSHLLELGRPGDAVKEFQRALALAPDDSIALCYLAYAFLKLKQPDKTLDYASRAIAADPNNEWPFRIAAHAHLEKDNRKSAYQAATRAVQLSPEDPLSLTLLGDCAYALGRHEEVRVLGELVRRQAPEETYGYHLLGNLAEAEDKIPEAAGHFEKVLELEPNNVEALDALARMRSRHNKFGESVSLLRGALSVDPTHGHRQNAFSDTMKRFAMFGEAFQRRKSVGGLLVMIFAVYLTVCVILFRALGPAEWLNQVILFGLCPVMLLTIPFLRGRFFATQAQQLHQLHENLSRQQRRRNIAAAAVIVVVAFGIAGIVYLDVGDPGVFLVPFALGAWAFWIYMFAITLRLVSLWLSDTWTRLMAKEKPEKERGLTVSMIALPVVAVTSLVIGVSTDHSLAWLTFFVSVVVSALVYFRRYQLATSAFTVVAGLVIVGIDVYTQSSIDDLTLGEFGFFIAGIGAIGLGLRGITELQKYWQRRRIGKLLVGRSAEA